MSKRAWLLLAVCVGVVVVVGGGIFVFRAEHKTDREQLGLTEFQSELAAGSVQEVELLDSANELHGTLEDGTDFVVRFPDEYTDEITTQIIDAGVALPVASESPSFWEGLWNNVGSLVILVLVLGALMYFVIRMYAQTILGFGKSRSSSAVQEHLTTRFSDVAGLDEAVEELVEIKDFLSDPGKFEALGARVPKGVLLYGPPGTGKTLLARAVAGEAGVPFISMSGSDFVEMYAGIGAARVRDLFKNARANAPTIVFIDEIDAVGRQRGAGLGGGHDEREQTLNQLLVELDGFDPRSGVILMAATNRPDMLDPALLRPGRFDRQVVVDAPDLEGRKGILRVHARGTPLADDADLDVLARRTPGMTGADLENVINEAALLSARRGDETISMQQLEAAIERILAGPERRTRVISDREKQIIATHEAGHALVGHALPSKDPVHKISIIPRGRALGYTMVLPTEDRLLRTRNELYDEMAMLLGGRTAEEIACDDMTTGAYDDIERTTELARRMVTEFGMSDEIGPVKLGSGGHEVFVGKEMGGHGPEYSQEVAARIDAEVERLVDEAHETARSILETHRAALDRLAAALIERETLDAADVEELLADVPKWNPQRSSGLRPAAVAATETPSSGRPLS